MQLRCSCGFEAGGAPMAEVQAAFQAHRCRRPVKWAQSLFENLFSMWGLLVVVVIGSVLTGIFVRP